MARWETHAMTRSHECRLPLPPAQVDHVHRDRPQPSVSLGPPRDLKASYVASGQSTTEVPCRGPFSALLEKWAATSSKAGFLRHKNGRMEDEDIGRIRFGAGLVVATTLKIIAVLILVGGAI